MKHWIKNILNHKELILLSSMILLFVSFFSYYGIKRHQVYLSEYYDLGIMDQTVYNTSRGRILQLTDPTGFTTINRLAIHADVFLAVLAPLYWLYSGPVTLIILQVFTVALGSVFIYFLSKEILKSKIVSLGLVFLYLMYLPLQWSVIFDFHSVTLTTTFILAFFFFLVKRRYLFSLFFAALAIISKEQVAVTIILMSVYFYLIRREKKFSIYLIFMSVIWLVSFFFVFLPLFRQNSHFALSRYQYLGTGINAFVIILQKIFHIATVTYLWKIFSPLAFLPLLSPFILFAMPDLLINILSDNANMQNILHHYTAVLTPVFFISAIYGIKFLIKRFENKINYLWIILVIALFFASYKYSPLPYSLAYDGRPFNSRLPETNDIQLLQRILSDENIKVAVSGNLGPHFSQRKTLIRFSSNYKMADYVVLLKDKVLADWYDINGSRDAYFQLSYDENFKLV